MILIDRIVPLGPVLIRRSNLHFDLFVVRVLPTAGKHRADEQSSRPAPPPVAPSSALRRLPNGRRCGEAFFDRHLDRRTSPFARRGGTIVSEASGLRTRASPEERSPLRE